MEDRKKNNTITNETRREIQILTQPSIEEETRREEEFIELRRKNSRHDREVEI